MSTMPVPPALEGLVDLASRNGVDVRPTLLRVLTDLYVQKPSHSPVETEQYLELALRLVEAVDPATRGIVAGRLVTYRAAPAAILQRLVELGALSQMPELALDASQATRHSQALMQQADAAQGEARPAQAAAEPMRDNDLAAVFFNAAAAERRQMLIQLASAQPAARRAARPDAADISRRLEAAALQRNPREFANVLERALDLSRFMAERITADSAGEPLVIVAKSIGMPVESLQRILMFLNPAIGMSARRVYDLAALFNDVTTDACNAMLDNLRDSGTRRRPEHQAVHYDDERTGARTAGTPAQRPALRRGAPLLDRYRGNGR